jgi:hypothetical protein
MSSKRIDAPKYKIYLQNPKDIQKKNSPPHEHAPILDCSLYRVKICIPSDYTKIEGNVQRYCARPVLKIYRTTTNHGAKRYHAYLVGMVC